MFRERSFNKRFFDQLANYENEVTEMFDNRNNTAFIEIARMGFIYATRMGDQEKFDEYRNKILSLKNRDYFTSSINLDEIITWGLQNFNYEGI